MKRGFLIILVIILLLSLSGLVVLISQRTSFFGRAYNLHQGEVSLENSYIFASPLQAKVGGEEKIRITVFLLDSSGRGVGGRSVSLGQHPSLLITPVQPVTDDLGRAIFDISANQAGEYLLEAKTDSQILPQRVKVIFR